MLNDQEVNKIIAEFMELPKTQLGNVYEYKNGDLVAWYKPYTENFKYLVPVLAKLKASCDFYYNMIGDVTFSFTDSDYQVTRNTLEQAAARATALAIKELEK